MNKEKDTPVAASFEQVWTDSVQAIRRTSFWHHLSQPPSGLLDRPETPPTNDEIMVDSSWVLVWDDQFAANEPARIGIEDLRMFCENRLGIVFQNDNPTTPKIRFTLDASGNREADRWDTSFEISVDDAGIVIRAATEHALLRASLYLSNYWSLRRNPYFRRGRHRIRPAVPLHIAADLWGGFCTTQAWIHGRETDDNFLELARMGVNAMPIMTLLEDYVRPDPSGPFRSLANPDAPANRARLGQLARQAARYGIRVLLMAYNAKLPPDHPVFTAVPESRGAIQSGGAFRTLCTSDPTTRTFIAESWRDLFDEIPELGGLLAITGGEGFYHCYMRSKGHAQDCPRCHHRNPSLTVAELVNDVARTIHTRHPEAVVLTWPYSAGHWSDDRDQAAFIGALDPAHVIFQTEVDKDSVDWRPAGYAKNIWDYSMSRVTVSPRTQHQRRLCRTHGLRFSVKIECNNSIECLNVPYLPALENQRAIWANARRLQPFAIHSRWLFDGAWKSPSEEMGFWMIWGRGTDFDDPDQVLEAIAQRDFGDAATYVRRAWQRFSEAMRHHPALDYYIGSYFIGPGQPLTLSPDPKDLDPVFYGVFYWQWEVNATNDDTAMTVRKPLFYARPGFRAIARRGPQRGQDVALQELQKMAALWEQGMRLMDQAKSVVTARHQKRFDMEYTLARHLAFTWRSAAHVEEFLRLRDTILEFSGQSWVRSGHRRENLRDLNRMCRLAEAELAIAGQDLDLIRGIDYLDLSLRLDMGVASTETIMAAKIRQVQHLLDSELPGWRDTLSKE